MELYEEWLKGEGFGVLSDDQIFEILHELREGNPNTARDMLGYRLMVQYLGGLNPVVTL